MTLASGHICILDIDWQVEIEYSVYDDDAPQIDEVNLIGVYLRGDHISKSDYTSLNVSIPVDTAVLSKNAMLRLQEIADEDYQERAYDSQD